MNSLSLHYLKKKFTKAENADRDFRSHMNSIFLNIFGQEVKLKELSLTPRAIVITAGNKSFAQELFLRKAAIQTHLEKHTAYLGRDLVIR